MGKHVIFLGAGASKSSGYPVADELRLLLSSESHFLSWVEKCFPKAPDQAARLANAYFEVFESSIELFRKGGFASVDEFCRSISDQRKRTDYERELVKVEHMRCLTRAVLAAWNPEDKFEDSEYYRFIQKLFRADSLETLRDDLSILSFNYDPYLEFLLLRAWAARNGSLPAEPDVGNSITGGFFNHQDLAWTQSDQPRLRLLKLHGSICAFPKGLGLITTDFLYEGPPDLKAGALFDPANLRRVPPIVFPWEILDDDLRFRDKDFPDLGDNNYRIFFRKIWERAGKEVCAAEKVSFVGLSMHDYLKLGFKYLFQHKEEGELQVVVANLLNKGLREEDFAGGHPNPNSPCWRAGDLIREVTNGRVLCRYSERDRKHPSFAPENTQPCITPRDSFADFIEHEL